MTEAKLEAIDARLMPTPYSGEKWLAFLERYYPDHVKRVRACRSKFASWRDLNPGCGRVFYKVSLCKDRSHCFVCSKVSTIGLADDAIEKFQKVCAAVGHKGVSYAGFELTLPPRYQRRLAVRGDGLQLMNKVAAATVQEVIGDPVGLRLGFAESPHFWHSSAPESGAYPHVHGTMLPVGFDSQGRAVALRLWQSPETLDNLRAVWQRRIKEVLGDDHIDGDWVVHWNFAYGEGHLRHRLEYQFRRPVEDIYRLVVDSVQSVDFDKGWLDQLMQRPLYEKRVSWYGFMADGVSGRYLSKIGVRLLPAARRKILRVRARNKCPCCGWEIHRQGGVHLYDEVLALGGIVLRRVRPPGGGGFYRG